MVVPLQNNPGGAQTFVSAAYIAGIDEDGKQINPPLTTDDSFTDALGRTWGFDQVQPLAPDTQTIIMYTAQVRAWPTR